MIPKLFGQRSGLGGAGADDDVDFDFIVSYNNSSFIPLHNAVQDRKEADPLPGVDAGPFVVERMKQVATQAPHLAGMVQSLAQNYQIQ